MLTAPTSDIVVVPKGTLLFSEGEAGQTAYFIRTGRIEIFLPLREGDLSLGHRGPGEIVGEMALIDQGCRSASARTIETCELSVVTDEQFARRLSNTDPVLRMCLAVVIDRYRQTVAMFDRVTAVRPPAGEAPDAPAPPNEHVAAALEALSNETELRRAIADDELELYFQPIVRLPDRSLAGFETLLRWNHPQRGLLSPATFIPAAEANGTIVEITTWCIARVGKIFPVLQAAATAHPGIVDPLFVSVNISGHDLSRPSFMNQLLAMLDETGMEANSIKLEITESVLMNEPLKAAAVLQECRARGLMIAIDDFGTGYSSLSHLSTLPINTIKIDQSFVRSMVEDPTSRKIIHMILRLAGELDIPVIAEGIEGEAEAAQLAQLGCDLGQGYLFGRPVPLAEALAVTRGWDTQEDQVPLAEALPPRVPRTVPLLPLPTAA